MVQAVDLKHAKIQTHPLFFGPLANGVHSGPPPRLPSLRWSSSSWIATNTSAT
jgi:hypothetical protein